MPLKPTNRGMGGGVVVIWDREDKERKGTCAGNVHKAEKGRGLRKTVREITQRDLWRERGPTGGEREKNWSANATQHVLLGKRARVSHKKGEKRGKS